MRAGVACFKIEGRLKGPEYVALTTRIYRDAVDAAWAALAAEDGLSGKPGRLAQQQEILVAARNEQGGAEPAAQENGAAAAAAAAAAAPPALSQQRLAELQQARARFGHQLTLLKRHLSCASMIAVKSGEKQAVQ